LLNTFTNPSKVGDSFGYSVASVGNDRALNGAVNYLSGVNQAGKAYLFRTNGTLLTPFTNPAPAAVQAFGWWLAAVGSDRVLIRAFADDNNGAPHAGSINLIGTNANLLTDFTNPAPAFDGGPGISVSVVSDRVLMGAPYNNTGAAGAGWAYLFSTNGTLLAPFTNPVPRGRRQFRRRGCRRGELPGAY
jgi:hypothetical protein